MITAKSGQTPVADKYRAYVLAGLDQLQTEVTTAGGIEAYIQGSVPGAKTAQITWNGEFLEVSTATYPFEVVKIPAIVVPEAALTTEVGPIQLTEWWCRQPEVLTAGCDTMQAEDPDSVFTAAEAKRDNRDVCVDKTLSPWYNEYIAVRRRSPCRRRAKLCPEPRTLRVGRPI